MKQALAHQSIDQIQERHRRTGGYFFSESNMRVFGTRLGTIAFAGANAWYFVTSQKRASETREYSVRVCWPNGDISTLGEYGQFTSLPMAEKRAKIAAYVSLGDMSAPYPTQVEREVYASLQALRTPEPAHCAVCGADFPIDIYAQYPYWYRFGHKVCSEVCRDARYSVSNNFIIAEDKDK